MTLFGISYLCRKMYRLCWLTNLETRGHFETKMRRTDDATSRRRCCHRRATLTEQPRPPLPPPPIRILPDFRTIRSWSTSGCCTDRCRWRPKRLRKMPGEQLATWSCGCCTTTRKTPWQQPRRLRKSFLHRNIRLNVLYCKGIVNKF